jgi:hypothetical protein
VVHLQPFRLSLRLFQDARTRTYEPTMLAFTGACSALQPSWQTPPPLRARHRTGPSGRRVLRRGLALALELWRASATLLHAERGSAAERGERGHVVLVTGANRGLGSRGPRN